MYCTLHPPPHPKKIKIKNKIKKQKQSTQSLFRFLPITFFLPFPLLSLSLIWNKSDFCPISNPPATSIPNHHYAKTSQNNFFINPTFLTSLLYYPCLAQATTATCPLTTITSRACPTATVTAPNGIFCPLLTCGPQPDCIILKTITEGCVGKCCPSATPTVTVPRTCPTCRTGCGTSFTTTTVC